jgi:hypothetical protein
MARSPTGKTPVVEITPDAPVALPPPASRTTVRERVLAGLVLVAAALLVHALTGGPWARATFADSESGDRAQVELRLSGDVDTDPEGGAVADRLGPSTVERSALEESVGAATRDLTQILAVLIVVVAAVGLVLDLRARLWGMIAAGSLVCLLAAAVLRDGATSALAATGVSLDAGPFSVDPTGWSGLAIGAAACMALASFLATAERGVAARTATPVFDPEDEPEVMAPDAEYPDGEYVDPTPPGAPGPAARPDPTAVPRGRARIGRATTAGRVRSRLLNSLPSRER